MTMAHTLRELRAHRQLTQGEVGEALGKPQSVVSRLEHQHDWHLSTLRAYVEALGGTLHITAVFDDADYTIVLPSEGKS